MLRTLLVAALLRPPVSLSLRNSRARRSRYSTIAAIPLSTNAKQNGITLGISPSPPYSSLDPGSNKASGLDVEIHEAALKWIGIEKIKYEVMPFGQLISAMLANRVDVVASNIHVTPDRLKAVSFTGPAWWYGPAIVVQKGNPAKVTSFEQPKGKKIGAIAGSAADEYLRKIGVEVTAFQTDAEEFSGIRHRHAWTPSSRMT